MTTAGSHKTGPAWPYAVPLSVGLIAVCLFLATLLAWNTLVSVPGNLVRPAEVYPQAAKIVVRAAGPGRVQSVQVETGQPVEENDVLIRLDRAGLGQRLARIEQDIRDLSALKRRPPPAEAGEADLIGKQTALINEQIKGLSSQRRAIATKLSLLEQNDNSEMGDEPAPDWKRAELRAEIAEIDARTAVLRARVSENDLHLLRLWQAGQPDKGDSAYQFAAAIDELETIAARLRAQMASREIRAPAAGMVRVSADLQPGMALEAGDPLLKIFPLNGTGIAEFGVEPNQAGLVRVGQTVRVIMNGTGTAERPAFQGRIVSLAPQASGYRARVEFDAGNTLLEAPASAIASIEIGTRSPTGLLIAPLTTLIADAINR